MQMYFAKIHGFICFFFDKKISNCQSEKKRKVMIIRDAHCFQLHNFPNEYLLKTKIDFEFSSENLLCSTNDFKHLSEISFYIFSAWTFPDPQKSTSSCLFINCQTKDELGHLVTSARPLRGLKPCSSFACLAMLSWNSQGHSVVTLLNKTNNLLRLQPTLVGA